MDPLLFLVHRIPYPPNKGDKIRSYHTLKYLAQFYRIFLGTFIDDEEDWQYEDQLKTFCQETLIRGINPFLRKIKSLQGILTRQALTLPYYKDKQLQQWVEKVVEENNINKIVIFSSSMAQYVKSSRYSGKTRVIDFVDVDSDKWLQYSSNKSWPENYIYKREANYLFNYEKSIARAFNASLFVTQEEARHFSQLIDNKDCVIDYFNNGVDTNYFKPDKTMMNPYHTGDRVIVFTGAMDYWANEDGVTWFVEKIFPAVRDEFDLKFYIVGSNPTDRVKNLEQVKNVHVTGRVPDIRPYLAYSRLAVAPLRIARGIQNKVLEAMAMESCVISSPAAMEGIRAENGKNLLVADSDRDYIDQIEKVISDQSTAQDLGKSARSFVLEHFSWDSNLSRLDMFLK